MARLVWCGNEGLEHYANHIDNPICVTYKYLIPAELLVGSLANV